MIHNKIGVRFIINSHKNKIKVQFLFNENWKVSLKILFSVTLDYVHCLSTICLVVIKAVLPGNKGFMSPATFIQECLIWYQWEGKPLVLWRFIVCQMEAAICELNLFRWHSLFGECVVDKDKTLKKVSKIILCWFSQNKAAGIVDQSLMNFLVIALQFEDGSSVRVSD